jgi:hypothetical protein
VEGPSRRECSERRDNDVHGAGVYWPIGVFRFAGGRLYCGGGPRGTVQGGIGAFSVMSVRIPYAPSVTPPAR